MTQQQKHRLTELKIQRDRTWRQYHRLEEFRQNLGDLSDQALLDLSDQVTPELNDSLEDICRSIDHIIVQMHTVANALSTKARELTERLYADR